MIIEITGTNFQNKGAELMLSAVASECLSQGHLPAVEPWNGSYLQRSRLGLHQKAQFQRFKIRWHHLAHIFPARLRRQYGVVTNLEIDAVLDASGFQFGDQWGAKIAANAADRFERWASQGRRIILLPQAFGPFATPSIGVHMRRILSSANLIFARDKVSLGHLESLNEFKHKLRLAPDFTNLLPAMIPATSPGPKTVCILPNQRMLDRSSLETTETYIKFLLSTLDVVVENGYRPVFLIHELSTDQPIVDKVRSRSDKPFETIKLDRAEEIKGYLGGCEIVIASRFHALVSALSQGVPVIATGWSHKYTHLLEDYGVGEALVSLDSGNADEKLVSLLEPDSLSRQTTMLASRRETLKQQSRAMWHETFEALNSDILDFNTRRKFG